MKWYYKCPVCGEWRWIEWENRAVQHECHQKKVMYTVPGPSDQAEAFVDQHDWPVEIDEVVYLRKGKVCCVPGCGRPADTLDHRIAWNNKGRTSVKNLWPMCADHNSSKGDADWVIWYVSEVMPQDIPKRRF